MVTEESATCASPKDKSYTRQPIPADHSQMVKFSHRSDPNYLDVKENIMKWVAEAPKIVEERFTPGLSIR